MGGPPSQVRDPRKKFKNQKKSIVEHMNLLTSKNNSLSQTQGPGDESQRCHHTLAASFNIPLFLLLLLTHILPPNWKTPTHQKPKFRKE